MMSVVGGVVVAVLAAVLAVPVLVVVGFLLTVAWELFLFGVYLARRALRIT